MFYDWPLKTLGTEILSIVIYVYGRKGAILHLCYKTGAEGASSYLSRPLNWDNNYPSLTSSVKAWDIARAPSPSAWKTPASRWQSAPARRAPAPAVRRKRRDESGAGYWLCRGTRLSNGAPVCQGLKELVMFNEGTVIRWVWFKYQARRGWVVLNREVGKYELN